MNIDSLLHVPREKKNLPCKTHHKFKDDSQLEFVKIKQSLKEERNKGPTFHKPSIVRMRRSASASISAFITSGSDLRWVSRFLSPKARETVSWPFTLATSPEIWCKGHGSMSTRRNDKNARQIFYQYQGDDIIL